MDNNINKNELKIEGTIKNNNKKIKAKTKSGDITQNLTFIKKQIIKQEIKITDNQLNHLLGIVKNDIL